MYRILAHFCVIGIKEVVSLVKLKALGNLLRLAMVIVV